MAAMSSMAATGAPLVLRIQSCGAQKSMAVSVPGKGAQPFTLSAYRRRTPSFRHSRWTKVQCSETTAVEESTELAPAITLSEKALVHLTRMRRDLSKDLLLRIGVRQGGCSGYSYVMDFEDKSNVRAEDSIIDHEGFSMVCDPKSLLFLYGMQLDYSDALIGGGFSFSNPNASSTCGCGKSFAA